MQSILAARAAHQGLPRLARSYASQPGSRSPVAAVHQPSLRGLSPRLVGVALAALLLLARPGLCAAPTPPVGCDAAGAGAGGSSALGTRQCRAQMRAAASASASAALEDQIRQKTKDNPVLVFSKTWCPFCASVKSLFKSLGIKHKVIELDQTADGEEVQDALVGVTGSHTVPQVFIGGTFVGGADDTQRAHRTGKLADLLSAAGLEIDGNADVVS